MLLQIFYLIQIIMGKKLEKKIMASKTKFRSKSAGNFLKEAH